MKKKTKLKRFRVRENGGREDLLEAAISQRTILAEYREALESHGEHFQHLRNVKHCEGVLDDLRKYFKGYNFKAIFADANNIEHDPPGK